MQLKKSVGLSFLFFLLCFLLIILIHLRGFVPHDEGWIINPASRLLGGEIPYKDFHFIYTPGTLLFTSLLFAVFGQSVFIARIGAAALALGSLYIVFTLNKKITKKTTLTYFASGIFLLWGPLHINFIWPVMFAIPAMCVTCLLLLKGITKDRYKYFFFSGISIACTMLSKQNFGIGIVLATLIYLAFFPKRKQRLLFVLLGICAGLIPVITYFVSTGSLDAFVNDMYYFMVEKTIFMSLQSTPFIYPAPLSTEVCKTIFYLSPLFISLTAVVIAFKTDKKYLIIGLASTFFYVFGIRPTTDYIHLIPLLSICGLPLAFIMSNKKYRNVRRIAILFGVFLISFGVYDILFRNYYRWDEPIRNHNVFSTNPRVHIWVSKNADSSLSQLTNSITTYSEKNDYIFIYAYDPLYYFVLNRRNPTRFDFFPPLTKADENEIVLSLKKRDVPIVITQQRLKGNSDTISAYIQSHYTIFATKPLYLWQLKPK